MLSFVCCSYYSCPTTQEEQQSHRDRSLLDRLLPVETPAFSRLDQDVI